MLGHELRSSFSAKAFMPGVCRAAITIRTSGRSLLGIGEAREHKRFISKSETTSLRRASNYKCGEPTTIIRAASACGFPTHKSSLIRRLLKEGAAPIEGEVRRGQRGFLYEVETLPNRFGRRSTGARSPRSPKAPTSITISVRRQGSARRQTVAST